MEGSASPEDHRGSGGRDGCVWRAGAYLGGVERARDGDCLAVFSPKSFLLFLSETRTPGKKKKKGRGRAVLKEI